jgi:uncharacterized membrane protein
MKKFIFLLAVISSFQAMAAGQESINCGFTEPFYDIDIDVNAKKVVINDIDWDSEDFRHKKTDISKEVNIVSSLVNGAPTITLVDNKTGKTRLTATLDFKGSDGMSDQEYAYSAVHKVGSDITHYGGCSSKSINAINVPSLDENEAAFFKDASKAVVLCYARAFSGWTSQASTVEKKTSVFTVLYRSDVVPGEPGDVSSTFSSAEGEELTRLANLASPVPYSGGELKAHKGLKIDFCNQYSAFLQNRYQSEAP